MSLGLTAKRTPRRAQRREWSGWGVCVLACGMDLQQLSVRMQAGGSKRAARRVAALARRVDRLARELMGEARG